MTCSVLAQDKRRDTMVTVKEIMKQDLITLPYGSTVFEAARTMRQRRIGSIFVRLNHRIVGIVTEADIVREVVGAERTPDCISVQDIMSFPIIAIEERSLLTDA